MQPTVVPMKKMGVVGLLVFLLLVSFSLPIPIGDNVEGANSGTSQIGNSLFSPSHQYDPNIIFQRGIVFDTYSNATKFDQWPRDFAFGDLNGDGLTDLALISNISNINDYITILNGTTDGGFSTTAWRINCSTTMKDPRNIAIGDLGDGKDDIVVSHLSSSSSPQITILYQVNKFDPTKSTTKDLYGSDPYELLVGHFGGTSHNDVAVVCSGNPSTADDHVTIWRYPFGSLSNSTDISIPGLTNSRLLAKGDINGDGRTDLIVGNKNGSDVVWIEQPLIATDPWSNSTTITVVGPIVDIQTADIAGNGRVDLAVAESSLSKIHLYYNTGSGLPSVPNKLIQTYSGLSSIALGKINGDAATDLVALSSAGNNASVFFESPSYNWYSKPNYTFPVNLGVVKVLIASSFPTIGDVLVLARGETNGEETIEQFFPSSGKIGNANMNFIAPYTPPSGLASGSFETGKCSIAATSPSTNDVLIFELGSDRNNKLATQNDPSGVDFGAFDPGTSDDLVVANTQSNSVSIYMGSSGIYTQRFPSLNVTLSLTYPSSIVTGRVQQLPVDDIVVGCKGGIVVLYNNETQPYFSPSLSETLQTGLTGNVTEVYIGDFNGDGTNGDIAALTEGSSTIQLFFRSSSGGVGHYYSQFPDVNLTAGSKSILTSMAVGDFNGDGRSDICATNDSSKAYVFLQPDYGFYDGEPWTYNINLHQTGLKVRSTDLNDDGISDLIVSYRNPPEIALYLDRGSGVFTNNMNFTTGGMANDLIAQDINGDGRADFASSSGSSFSLSLWFQNNLAPVAHASASKYTEKEGVNITFSGSGSNDSYSDRSSLQYSWTFNLTDNATGESVTHSFLKPGVYEVSLEVTDRGGLSNWSNLTITILKTYPVANFTWSPSSPIEGQPVSFIDLSSYPLHPIESWNWSFGDSKFSNNRNPIHTYVQWGHYQVALRVTDTEGTINTTNKGIDIADTRPAASFTNSSSTIKEGGSITFTDTSVPGYDPIIWRRWEFGDGGISNNITSITHKFNLSGLYRVNLTVWDKDHISNRTWQEISVLDILPVANFTYAPNNPKEGVQVNFTDTSAHYVLDPLVSWSWNFGDGNSSTIQNSSHTYANDGNYTVTLIVRDSDGAIAQKAVQITVDENSPIILGLNATSGLTSFNEDQIIMFTVRAEPGWEPIVRYEWNFSFSGDFVVDYSSPLNFSTHSFPQKGNYLVVVRVWDDDWYTEKRLWISVLNVAPTADFSNTTVGNGVVRFDASHSTDTPHDVPLLMYRWNFDDGTNWQNWSSDPILVHIFSKNRVYNVTLEVRDDDLAIGTITKKITVTVIPPDTISPVISNVTFIQTAVVGKPITVSATVTDNSGQVTAFLYFKNGDKTNSTPMTKISGNVFEGQIPSQNSSGKISFWIVALDPSQNNFTTGEFEIVIEKPIPPEYWAAGFVGAVAILAGLFVGFRRVYATVDEAFIIYEDGRLIAHQTRHLKPGMDDEVLSSMLVAIQDFVKDSFKDEGTTALKRLDFGDKRVLVEKGDRVYLAAVLHGKYSGKIPQKMLLVIEEIRRDFGAVFAEWDGNFESMRGVKDKTQPLFKKQWSITRIIRFRRSSEKTGPLMIECPICDQRITADSKKCPSCGVDLTNASVSDLEQVAHDISHDKNGSSSLSEQETASIQNGKNSEK
ncbi:MAG: PKD domain-containing protein [Methanomassiliicoccales archaeon]